MYTCVLGSSPPLPISPPTTLLQDEKLLLLMNNTELLHPEFLTCLYELVKDCAISHLFSPEERSRVISAVRSDLTQAGLTFSRDSAWQFFIRSVHCQMCM